MTAAAALRGEDVVLYVNTAAAGCTPVYEVCALQRGMNNQRTATEIDTSSKETGAWATSIIGRIKETLTLDGLVPDGSDTKWTALNTAFEARTSILVRVYNDSVAVQSGVAYVTELSKNHPDNEVSTYTCGLAISGGLKTIS